MRTLLLLLGILFSQLLLAQNEVVVVHSAGKAMYYAPQQNTAQNIYPGLRMSIDGRVRCQAGGSIKLMYNGETFTFNDGKMRSLRELEQLTKGGVSIGFVGRFWSFLTGSMKQSKDEKSLEDNHRRYMESVYAGVKGFTRQQYAIQSSLLYSSSLSDTPVTFAWSGAGTDQSLRFLITSKAADQVIASVVLRGSVYSVDLSQLALEPGVAYEWQVLPEKDSVSSAPRSAKTTFVYDPQGAARALASLLPDPDYQHAFPAEQLLMQAFVLENAGFYYDAAQKYASAAAANPRNILVRDARAAFLSRMDLLQEAKQVLSQEPIKP